MQSRTRTVSLILSAVMALAFATTAAAGTPPSGQGLIGASDQGITSLSCSDPSITIDDLVFTPGGGAPNWTVDGRMYVLQSIEVSGTITTPDGSFPVSFSKTWGNKTGLGEVVTCIFEQEATENGATLDATGTATVVRIR
jgi:hypothetical protein